MDNNAFKDLVRSKVKSTKEIAREAVEEAFLRKKKKRKRKGRGGGSDDDLSSSDSEPEDGRKQSRLQQPKDQDNDGYGGTIRNNLKPTSVYNKRNGQSSEENKEDKPHATRYRDRAKERREGKNKDYNDSQLLLETVAQGCDEEASLDQTEISKYLGGDEAHTHLVKGLDVALARSVRQKEIEPALREMANQQPTIMKEKIDLYEDLKRFDSLEESWKFINEEIVNNSPANLNPSTTKLLEHLRRRQRGKKDIQVTAAGSSIQRSHLSFSIDWHPQNISLSWEIPLETSQAAATTQNTSLPKASPIPADLIQQMQRLQNKKQKSSIFSLNDKTSSQGGKTNSNSKQIASYDSNNSATNPGGADDSDDDIFPGM